MTLLEVRGSVNQPHPSSLPRHRVDFAHESEGLLASLFTLYGVEWLYEPHEFVLRRNASGAVVSAFRPDFYLPALSLYVELTVMRQSLVTSKNRKVRLFRELYPEVELRMIYKQDFVELMHRHGLSATEAASV